MADELQTSGSSKPESPTLPEKNARPDAANDGATTPDDIDSTQPIEPLRVRDDETTVLYSADFPSAVFEIPEGPLEEKFAALLQWLEPTTQYDQAFIVDGSGLLLIGDRAAEEVVSAAVSLGAAWNGLQGTASLPADAPLAVDLPGSRRLHIYSFTAAAGIFRLAFLTPKTLARPFLETVRCSFEDTLRRPADSDDGRLRR